MSWIDTPDPVVADSAAAAIEQVVESRPRDIGGLAVGRVLPSPARQSVGPYVFFDHMGPAELAAGHGVDVRPHPHIHLATVTYLFEGEILHRDSLGSHRVIRPGAINWMTAGRGIVHSERTPPELRATGSSAHGIQLWVALPEQHEDAEPSFEHHAADTLPVLDADGVTIRVLNGVFYGATSPARTLSPMFYVDATMPAGTKLRVPDEHEERAAYVVHGEVECEAERVEVRRLVIFRRGSQPVLRAARPTRVILIGGAPLGERFIWWNFVSSSKERIEQAAHDWIDGRFPKVVGDAVEFIPLEGPPRFSR